jgi:epoxyqueuosine reductase
VPAGFAALDACEHLCYNLTHVPKTRRKCAGPQGRPHVWALMDPLALGELITNTIKQQVAEADTVTTYRAPLVGFVAADDPRFYDLRRVVEPTHLLPQDLLPDAKSVVSFFIPFDPQVVEVNAQHREKVAEEWALAYVETNALIGRITAHLVALLSDYGTRAAAIPATHNFDPDTLASQWSHKSIAVLAGLGSFGLHHLLITDSGCAGRLGSLVIDAAVPIDPPKAKERCLYFHDGSCVECVWRCPVDALDQNNGIDKQRCWERLRQNARVFEYLGMADMCGKCSIGPCSFESAVKSA